MIDKNILAELNENYNKTSLEKGIFPFVKKFYKQHSSVIEMEYEIAFIQEKIEAKKPITKPELMTYSFSVFVNEIIYKKFIQFLPEHIKLLIEKLLWVNNMSEAEVELLINQTITIIPTYSYYASINDLKGEYYFFTVKKQITNSYPEKGFYVLSLTPVFKQVLVKYYPKPVHYNFVPIADIPPTSFSFTAENSIISEFPKVLSYYMQQGIKYSNKGKPLDGTLNKLQRSCGITEFQLTYTEELGKIRSTLIAGLLYDFNVDNVSIDTVSMIKELFKHRYTKLHSAQFILNHLKGWGFMDDNYDYATQVENKFLNIVKELPQGKWVSCTNLIELIECRFINLQPVSNAAAANRLYYQSSFNGFKELNYEEKFYVGSKNYYFIYQPFIRGTIFLYAAFGLVEIMNREIDTKQFSKTYYSAYDGLEYFKLTALGAYVFGQTETYESANGQQKNKLQLSDDSLMILAEGEMGVIDIMLANFAEKAGASRYKVTPAHFLKNCQTIHDIDKKVTLFKKTISTSLPIYWQIQFETWRGNSFKINIDITTRIFKISETDRELQKLIVQDVILKGLIMKAEHFNILVPINNVAKFKARMKELSYVIE